MRTGEQTNFIKIDQGLLAMGQVTAGVRSLLGNPITIQHNKLLVRYLCILVVFHANKMAGIIIL